MFTLFLFLSRLVSRNVSQAEEMNATLAGLFGGLFVTVGMIIVHMLAPDIWIRDDGFQIRTLLYRSQWLKWEDIQAVEEHFLSSSIHRTHSILINQISSIYSFIGFVQQMNGRGFILSEKIQDYDALIQTFKVNRPDLFSS